MKKLFIIAMVTLLGFSFVGVSTVIAQQCEGTGTPGYWKNHLDAWGDESIIVGGTPYTPEQAIVLMKTPVKGDKSLTLFKATVAAMLNVSVQNCDPPPDDCLRKCWKDTQVCDPLGQANAWLADNNVLSGVSAHTDEWQYSHGESIYWCLDDYNNGLLNEPARD